MSGLESGGDLVFVVDLRCRRICINNVSTVAPDGLEPALQPSELAVIAVGLEFAQEAMDIGRLARQQRVGVVHEDPRCALPRREPGPRYGGRQHRGQSLEREEWALEEGRRHREGDGAGDTGGGKGSMRPDIDDESGGVGEPGREGRGRDGGERCQSHDGEKVELVI